MYEPWVIRKGAHFFRAGCAGYTSDIAEAGIYTQEEAEAVLKSSPDKLTILPLEAFRVQIEGNFWRARGTLQRLNANRVPTREQILAALPVLVPALRELGAESAATWIEEAFELIQKDTPNGA